MIETRRLKNVVIFVQTILSFVLSRKCHDIETKHFNESKAFIEYSNDIYNIYNKH